MIHERAHDWVEILEDVLEQPGRVRPHFQPIVDLQRGEVCGYEALARFAGWRELRPADVFAAAERLGLGRRARGAHGPRGARRRPHLSPATASSPSTLARARS